MAGEKQLEQRLRMKLSRDKATYQTQLSRRETALRISTDPKESAERRAEAKKDYERLVKEIKDLKNSIEATQRNVTKEKVRKSSERYDPEEGKKQANAIKEKFALLEDAYAIDESPAIKKQMDALVSEYKDVYSSVIGKPISTVAAKSALIKKAPSFDTTKSNTGATGPTVVKGPSGASGPSGSSGSTGGSGPSGASGPTGVSGSITMGNPTGVQGPGLGGRDGSTGASGPTGTKVKSSLETLLARTEFWYDLPDYIFKLDPKLGELLVRAVDEGWDPNTVEGNAKFLNAAKLTPWWQKNSATIRTRIVDREKYNDLKAAGEDVTKTEYGLYLKKQMGSVKAKAKELAGVTLTDEQAQSVAQKIYDGFLDDDPLAINALIVPFIGKVTSIVGNGIGGKSITGFSGQALKDYQTLQGIAKANGFTIKDILPNISATMTGGDLETAILQKLALGELDINRIAQDARMLAATGQPEYVRGLLNQGYDLENIYAPYRYQMATVLEIDQNTIDLNDPTLRAGITDKGDMNLYDYKKTLRKDPRWQYTAGANGEVADATKQIIQDFGFMG